MVGAVVASDPDAEDTAVTYAVTGGADMALFDIAGDTGALFFPSARMAPDYENPDDADADNDYHLTVTATGGTGDRAMTATQEITVTVTDALEPPSAPDAPAVTAVDDNIARLTVDWTAPDNTGRPAIESYDLRYRKGSSGGWTDGPQDRTATVADIDGLETGSEYQVQVRATNDEGDGDWSESGAGIPGAGVTLAITLSLDLDERVTVTGSGVAQVREDFGPVRIGLRAETNGVRPTEDFTVTLDAVDGTAVAGEEYEWPSPAYTFRAADFMVEEGRYVLTASNDLEIVDDQVVEAVAFLELEIDGTTLPPYVTASAAVEGQVVEIRDDDRARVRFVDIVMNEGEEFEGRLVLDRLVEIQLSIGIRVQSNATYDKDEAFEYADFSVTFAPLATEATFTLTSIDNDEYEADQVFEVDLSGLTTSSAIRSRISLIEDPTPTVTVVNDDPWTLPSGPIAEVDADGDGIPDDYPVVTLPIGGEATYRVRPGPCEGRKSIYVNGMRGISGEAPSHIGVDSSGGGGMRCRGENNPGEWREITLYGPTDVDTLLAAPFEASVRHTVQYYYPPQQHWYYLMSGGHLVTALVPAPETTLAPVGSLTVGTDASDQPDVSWSPVSGATRYHVTRYQVQWRWGSDEYGRVHRREERIKDTSLSIPISTTLPVVEGMERNRDLHVRVRAYDSGGLAVGPWREASLPARTEPRRVVDRITLLEASLGTVLATLTETDSGVIKINDPEAKSYSFEAHVVEGEKVGSLKLTLSRGTVPATDNDAPYMLQENGMALRPGKYTLTVQAYGLPNAGLVVQGPGIQHTLTVSFEVVTDVLAGFTLVDADASPQTELATLTDGGTVELPDPEGGSYAIRADAIMNRTAGSVVLELTGAKTVSRTEDSQFNAPYSLYGDRGRYSLNGEPLPAGEYTLKATAFSGPNGEGALMQTLEVSFTVRAAP